MYHGGSEWLNGEPPLNIRDFSVNLNPLGTPQFIEELIIEAVKKKVYRYYPDSYKSLKEKIAEIYNVNPEYIAVYNGSVEALRLLPNEFSVPEPNFSEYPRKFSYRCTELEDSFNCELRGEKVITSNPINPSGFCFSLREIEEFLEKGKILVLDEAFVDISDCESAVRIIEEYDNLLIISTFTKSLSVPGLRIGFSIGKLSKTLESRASPWRINSIAYYVFSHVNSDDVKKFLTKSRQEVLSLLHTVVSIRHSFKVYKSRTLFVLTEFPIPANIINAELMRKYNYRIREPNGFIGLRDTHARISLNYDTRELFRAIEEILDQFYYKKESI